MSWTRLGSPGIPILKGKNPTHLVMKFQKIYVMNKMTKLVKKRQKMCVFKQKLVYTYSLWPIDGSRNQCMANPGDGDAFHQPILKGKI